MLKLPEKINEAGYGERWLKLVEATPLGDRQCIWLEARRDPHLGVYSVRCVNEACPDGVTDLLIEHDAYDDDGGALGTAVICLTRMCGAAVRPWATKTGLWARARPIAASDEYYAWWTSEHAKVEDYIYHFSEKVRVACQCGWVADSTLTVLHIDSFRCVSVFRFGEDLRRVRVATLSPQSS